MRLFALTAAITATATTAFAGDVTYVAPMVVAIEEPVAMGGGSGAWIIPLLAIALIALAMNSDDPV